MNTGTASMFINRRRGDMQRSDSYPMFGDTASLPKLLRIYPATEGSNSLTGLRKVDSILQIFLLFAELHSCSTRYVYCKNQRAMRSLWHYTARSQIRTSPGACTNVWVRFSSPSPILPTASK
jgi:hypothetical protein